MIFEINRPEEAFTVACLAGELSGGDQDILPPEGLDWDRLVRLLESNRLAAHFYSLSGIHKGMIPESARSSLKKSRYANLLYGDFCRQEIHEVLLALTEKGIQVIVLKGWALIQWLYQGDHGQRYCEDIDILIPPGKVDEAEGVLSELAFQGSEEVQPGYTRRFFNARSYTRKGQVNPLFRDFVIGLHWGLTHYPYYDENQIPIQELFSRALPIKVAGVDVLELCIEDQLVYTCAHLGLHHRNEENLLNYFEIAAILRRGGAGLDWEAVAQRASSWHYLVQVQNALRQIRSLWPWLLPAGEYEKLENMRAPLSDRWIDRLVEGTKKKGLRSALVEILAMPGLGGKLHAAKWQLFPGRDYMRQRYGSAAEEGLFKLYLMRVGGALRGLFRSGRS